jgi:N-acetyl-gamma-glutamyl-phosphate reductase
VTVLKVAVAGATGYMGAELLRLLVGHPEVEITAVTSERSAGGELERLLPSLRGHLPLTLEALDPARLAKAADVVFLALPHTHAMAVVPVLLAAGKRVIDLSADYRLKDPAVFHEWYRTPHADPAHLPAAAYGLPELHRKAIASASLVASPGCYPTGAILALAPLLARGLVQRDGIIVDAKSGVTGAGKTLDIRYLFAEANENLQAYGVAGHRQTPEMEQELSAIAEDRVSVTFTPHLVPLNRGLLTTAYATLNGSPEARALLEVFQEFYAREPFVRVFPAGDLPQVRAVLASNYCDIGLAVDRRVGRVIVVSAIDNLGKGGSAQAVQNLNIMQGWDERTGLNVPPVYP